MNKDMPDEIVVNEHYIAIKDDTLVVDDSIIHGNIIGSLQKHIEYSELTNQFVDGANSLYSLVLVRDDSGLVINDMPPMTNIVRTSPLHEIEMLHDKDFPVYMSPLISGTFMQFQYNGERVVSFSGNGLKLDVNKDIEDALESSEDIKDVVVNVIKNDEGKYAIVNILYINGINLKDESWYNTYHAVKNIDWPDPLFSLQKRFIETRADLYSFIDGKDRVAINLVNTPDSFVMDDSIVRPSVGRFYPHFYYDKEMDVVPENSIVDFIDGDLLQLHFSSSVNAYSEDGELVASGKDEIPEPMSEIADGIEGDTILDCFIDEDIKIVDSPLLNGKDIAREDAIKRKVMLSSVFKGNMAYFESSGLRDEIKVDSKDCRMVFRLNSSRYYANRFNIL